MPEDAPARAPAIGSSSGDRDAAGPVPGERLNLCDTSTREARAAVPAFTVTLCWPVRLGDSQRSWVSETVRVQGVSPISTV